MSSKYRLLAAPTRLSLGFICIMTLIQLGLPHRIMVHKNITVPSNKYQVFDYEMTKVEESNDQGLVNGTFQIRLKNPGDSASFDLFFLSETDLSCYEKAIEKKIFIGNCEFLNDPSKTNLNLNQTSFKFLNSMIKDLSLDNFKIIIDNTRFPKNGASYTSEFEIEVFYILDISPSDKFYILTIAIGIVFGIFILIMIVIISFVYQKYKKLDRTNKELEQDIDETKMGRRDNTKSK